jgi:hypothetical protein
VGPGPAAPAPTAFRGRRRIGAAASYWGGAERTGVAAWVGMTFDVGGG